MPKNKREKKIKKTFWKRAYGNNALKDLYITKKELRKFPIKELVSAIKLLIGIAYERGQTKVYQDLLKKPKS